MRGRSARPCAVLAQLRLHGGVVGDRVGAVERGEVEHVHEQAAALDVREELVAEPGAGAGALDQPGDVGEHELAVVALERAEHRLERGERVVGHLRARARQRAPAARTCRRWAGRPGRRRRAASARASASAPGRAARFSAKRGAWRVAVAKCLLPRPPPPPRATTARSPARVRSQRSPSSGSDTTVPGGTRTSSAAGRGAVLVGALAVPAAGGLEVRAAPERREVAQRAVDDDLDVAAAPAVAAVGPALRHVRLAPERDHPVAAGAAAHVDLGAVGEHR